MSSSPPSQKCSLDDPSDPPSKIRHLLIANDATTERSHALGDQLVVANLLYKRDLDLKTLTRPLVEQDYADIFCAITVLEAGNNVHRDWMYDGPDKDNRLCLFQRGVVIAGEHFFDALKEASKDRTFKSIRNAAFLREPFPISTWKPSIKAGYHGMRHALREAWNTPYVSDCHKILIEIMTRIKEGEEDECCGPSDFNNTVMIVQSSGTGKSRMVDEAARLVFTIPFNLQSENNLKRYPPPDNDVRKYMCQIWSGDILRTRYHAFIFCLCRTIAAELHSIFKGPKIPQAQFASIWRDHLAQKDVRSNLYKTVVDQANQASQSELLKVGAIDANPAAYSMYEKTYPELENLRKTIASKVNDLGGKVDILMYFDEAQELMKAEDSPQDRAYRALCSVLNDYGDCQLFTVFLSTVPHIAESVTPVITTRVYGHKLGEPKAPITGAPFDCAPDILVTEYAHDRGEIAKPHFTARFGRPLFWTTLAQIPVTDHETVQTFLKKLRSKPINNPNCDILPSEWECKELGKLAVADVRLSLQYEPNLKSFKEKAVEVQAKLVANHMRIAYSFPAHRRYFVSGYPSEPLLAEAAAQQLHHWRKTQPSFLLDIVHHHMETGLLDRADRGEVVARILILEAYDRGVTETFTPNHDGQTPLFGLGCRLTDWISQLFAHDLALEILHSKRANGATEDQTFEEVFKDAWIRVTHYAQAGDEHVFNAGTHAMFAAFVRGMAFICRDSSNRNGGNFVNSVVPVLLRDVKIGSSVMSAVFVRVPRRAGVSMGTYPIIDAEKHFDFFHPEPDGPSEDDRPYVTLIMDLGVRDPILDRAVPLAKAKLPPTKHKVSTITPPIKIKHSSHSQSQSRKQKHPRYEIHISGCSNTLYNLIPPASPQLAKYKEILHMPEFLPEHTRKATIAQAMQMKPVFLRGKESYVWIESGVLNPGPGDANVEDEGGERYVVGGHPNSEECSDSDTDWDRISSADSDIGMNVA